MRAATIKGMTTAADRWKEHARSELSRAGTRTGAAREAVVSHLGDQDCCLSAQEVFDGFAPKAARSASRASIACSTSSPSSGSSIGSTSAVARRASSRRCRGASTITISSATTAAASTSSATRGSSRRSRASPARSGTSSAGTTSCSTARAPSAPTLRRSLAAARALRSTTETGIPRACRARSGRVPSRSGS